MQTIAIQGITGSFHHQAAQRLVPDAVPLECTTFFDVFEAVKNGKAEYGVVAIENSLQGSINAVYRLLHRSALWVAGETTLHVELYLIGSTHLQLQALNTENAEVRTMFPAFAETELWLHKHLPHAQRIEISDTALGVRQVVAEANPLHVAIAGKYAADLHSGTVVAGPINDDPHNYTRFILLTKNEMPAQHANRTSLILTVGHTEGALYEALGVFAAHSINLSKLDSHPIPSDKRHYAFYVDLEAGLHDTAVQSALRALAEKGCTARVLGSYHV